MRKLKLFTLLAALCCSMMLWAQTSMEYEGPWLLNTYRTGCCSKTDNLSISMNGLNNSKWDGTYTFWNDDYGIGWTFKGNNTIYHKCGIFSSYSLTQTVESYSCKRLTWSYKVRSKSTKHYSNTTLYARRGSESDIQNMMVDFTEDYANQTASNYVVGRYRNTHQDGGIWEVAYNNRVINFDNKTNSSSASIQWWLMLTHVVSSAQNYKTDLYEWGAFLCESYSWATYYYKIVNFNGNGSTSGSMSQQAIETSGNLTNNAFSRTGYTFAGWATSSNGNVAYANQANISVNQSTRGVLNLYAKWTANTYKVKFNGNGSTSGSMSDQNFTYDAAQNLTANAFSKTGYTFAGWATSADGAKAYDNQQSVNNLTATNGGTFNLYAVWSVENYTISYTLNGGTASNPANYNITTNTFTLNNPTRDGYMFTGWTGSNGSTPQTEVSIAQGSTGNKNYTANWISQAAVDVMNLINAIGTPITLDSKDAIDAARAAYNVLTDAQKTEVTNYATLTNAEAALAVVNLINAIDNPVVYTTACHDEITGARTAFEALTAEQKALVDATTLQVLTDAEAAYAVLEADHNAANAVIDLINAIDNPVVYTDACHQKILAAREAYNNLTQAQKALVDATTLQKLTDAEAAYAALEADHAAADAVIAQINAIGSPITAASQTAIDAARNAYDNLTDDQKALVGNLSTLTNAEAALAVIDLINAIDDPVVYTDACHQEILDARAAYNNLTQAQKALVGNYATLTDAEAAYAALDAANPKPWSTNNALPTASGTYYLTTDVNLSNTWNCTQNIVLDLNGHIVSKGGDKDNNVINVINNCSLVIKDSDPDAIHYFQYKERYFWRGNVYKDYYYPWQYSQDQNPSTYTNYEDLTFPVALNTVIALKGGCITGGAIGIQVHSGTCTLESGNIVGNYTRGIEANTYGESYLNITGGRVCGNYSFQYGSAGIWVGGQNNFVFIGGEVMFNVSNSQVGAVMQQNNPSTTLGGSIKVRYNAWGNNRDKEANFWPCMSTIPVPPYQVTISTEHPFTEDTYIGLFIGASGVFAFTPKENMQYFHHDKSGFSGDCTMWHEDYYENAEHIEAIYVGYPLPYNAPTAKNLVYNGNEQELINAGSLLDSYSNTKEEIGGVIYYSTDGENWSTEIPKGTNAGDYTVYYKIERHSDLRSAGPVEPTLIENVKIEGLNPTLVTAPTVKSNLSYTGEAQVLVNAGSASHGTINYSLDNENWSAELPVATNVGTHRVYYKVVGDPNYKNLTANSYYVNVTISKAHPVITAPTAKSGLKYTGSAQALVNAGSTTGGTMQYKVGSGSWGTSIPTGTDVGTYTVYYQVEGNDNYNGNNGSSFQVTIAQSDQQKADAVIAQINAIGSPITLDSKDAIDAARAAYDALTAEQKALVDATTLQVLTDAEAAYAALEADHNAANAVIDLINAIDDQVVYTDACHQEILDAREAYNNLTQAQKDLIDASTLQKLTDAEDAYASLNVDITAKLDPEHPSVYYSTFYDGSRQMQLPADVEAYTATVSGDKMLLKKVAVPGDILPAATAVVLRAPQEDVTLTPSDATPVSVENNALLGTDVNMDVPSDHCYVLSGADGFVGFYPLSSPYTLTAHKAYIDLDNLPGGANNAPRRLRFVFNEEQTATGMERVQNEETKAQKIMIDGVMYIIRGEHMYDAQGQIVK